MNAAIEALLEDVDRLKRALRSGPGKQIQAESDCEKIRQLCGRYFGARAEIAESDDAVNADGLFKNLHSMSRGHPGRPKTLEMLAKARKLLVALEGSTLTAATAKLAGRKTATDQLIIDTLREVCPSAAAAYSQAMEDLSADTRGSWRGPATDLREALRETLDVLAPDSEVKNAPGFKLEKDTHGPTMKQKVRYILKNRGTPSGAMTAPETAVQGIEEIVGGLTRSVYTRSSISTHTATDKKEVVRVHAWVRLVLCDLLEVPPE
jgi:Predicted pPIWI-associating nuclease